MPVSSLCYTQMPNEFYDVYLKQLSGSAVKVFDCIGRKYFGFHKSSPERISISQIQEMTGLGKQAILKALNELISIDLIERYQYEDDPMKNSYWYVKQTGMNFIPDDDKSGMKIIPPSSLDRYENHTYKINNTNINKKNINKGDFDEDSISKDELNLKTKSPRETVPPAAADVESYLSERRPLWRDKWGVPYPTNISVEAFMSFYESKGWLVGKTKMKSWKAAIRTWEASAIERIPELKKRLTENEYDSRINDNMTRSELFELLATCKCSKAGTKRIEALIDKKTGKVNYDA